MADITYCRMFPIDPDDMRKGGVKRCPSGEMCSEDCLIGKRCAALGPEPTPAKPACGNCHFGKDHMDPAEKRFLAARVKVTEARTIVICRRYPAELEKRPSDWCGEHEERR